MVHIGEKIKALLEKEKRPAAWLSREIGTTPQNITKILRNPRPPADRLKKISEVMGHDFVQYLFPDSSKLKVDKVIRRELEVAMDELDSAFGDKFSKKNPAVVITYMQQKNISNKLQFLGEQFKDFIGAFAAK